MGSADHDMSEVRKKLEVRDDDVVIALIDGAREMRRVRRINADTIELWPLGTRAENTPIEIGPRTGEVKIVEAVGRRIADTR